MNAKRLLAFARYVHVQLFVRRPVNLLVLFGALMLTRIDNPFPLLGAGIMLGNLPLLALHWLPPQMPAPRRWVLLSTWPAALTVVLASLCLSLASESGGRFPGGAFVGTPVQITSGEGTRAPRVTVAGRLWEIGVKEARWVELPGQARFEAERRQLLGLPLYAHNPYTVPPGAQSELAAQQIQRALNAGSELRLTRAQIVAHLEHRGPAPTQSLEHASAWLSGHGWAQELMRHLILLIIMLTWTRLTLTGQPSARGSLRRQWPRWAKLAVAVTALHVVAGVTALLVAWSTLPFLSPLFTLAVVRGAIARSFESWPVFWLGGASCVAVALARLLQVRFQRLEVPLQQSGAVRAGAN